MNTISLRTALERGILTVIQPETRREIPDLLDALGIPGAPDDPEMSKAKYIRTRTDQIPDNRLAAVAEVFLERHGYALDAKSKFDLEEHAWTSEPPTVTIQTRTRYELARALEGIDLFLKAEPFLELVRRLWDRDADPFIATSRLLAEVERHMVRNPGDWEPETFFERIDAFEASDRRLCLFLEGLNSHKVRPDEASQRTFAEVVNRVLGGTGVEFREVGTSGGFPVFRLVPSGPRPSRPKNLIFASCKKPDIRIRDVLIGDIEILSHADDVLVYDRPLTGAGLSWGSLRQWWNDLEGVAGEKTGKGLDQRLLQALPPSSPPQRRLFEVYASEFSGDGWPALLPEVWLHWDPKTIPQRKNEEWIPSRMDFLLLLPNDVRVVLEVDGTQHYSDSGGQVNPRKYAEMARADRALKLGGYEVYRFGAAELGGSGGAGTVKQFCTKLYDRHHVRS